MCMKNLPFTVQLAAILLLFQPACFCNARWMLSNRTAAENADYPQRSVKDGKLSFNSWPTLNWLLGPSVCYKYGL